MANAPLSKGQRSTKVLSCTADATRYQRDYVQDLKRRVIDNGEPFAIVQADTPHEIFHVMDIPIVTNQWWSSYIAAKQLSPRYVQVLEKNGYTGSTCKYCSLGLACTLDNDPATAPWGGLPKPTVLVARLTCDCIQRVFRLWAECAGLGLLSARSAGVGTQGHPLVRAQQGRLGERLFDPAARPDGRGDEGADRTSGAEDRAQVR